MRTQNEAFRGQASQILAIAKEVATARGWKLSSESASELEFKTSVSIKSWGETIKVRTDWNSISLGAVNVTVSSSARFQAYDWGRSTDNVNALLTGIRQRVQGPQPPSMPPAGIAPVPAASGTKFCSNCGTKLAVAMPFCTRCGQRTD